MEMLGEQELGEEWDRMESQGMKIRLDIILWE
jgi:hypothetical protein